MVRVAGQDDPWKITGVALFGLGLVALYAASTLYHAIRGPLKALLRRADHAAVFLLIAGTYAPFALGPLRGPVGLTLFTIVWLMAAAGIWQSMRRSADRDPSPVPHLIMGWIGAAALIPLNDALGPAGRCRGLWCSWRVDGSQARQLAVQSRRACRRLRVDDLLP
jgi:hemolysin III